MATISTVKHFLEGHRTLSLEPMPGAKATSSKGMTDPRLFTGENKLHAERDPTSLWSLRYEMGNTPQQLKGSYTKLSAAIKVAEDYFATRNIAVKEILE